MDKAGPCVDRVFENENLKILGKFDGAHSCEDDWFSTHHFGGNVKQLSIPIQ